LTRWRKYGANQIPAIQRWLASHPRFHMHFHIKELTTWPVPIGWD